MTRLIAIVGTLVWLGVRAANADPACRTIALGSVLSAPEERVFDDVVHEAALEITRDQADLAASVYHIPTRNGLPDGPETPPIKVRLVARDGLEVYGEGGLRDALAVALAEMRVRTGALVVEALPASAEIELQGAISVRGRGRVTAACVSSDKHFKTIVSASGYVTRILELSPSASVVRIELEAVPAPDTERVLPWIGLVVGVILLVGACAALVARWRHRRKTSPVMHYRDVGRLLPRGPPPLANGRKLIVVIGVDQYAHWPRLSNAVSDARGALAMFEKLGFSPPVTADDVPVAPLLDGAATAARLAVLHEQLRPLLQAQDSLVVFFAGHGHTETQTYSDGTSVKTGYVIPTDGLAPDGPAADGGMRRIRLDTWLSDLSRLPVQHLLVILDACHSGVALGSLIKWRGVTRRSFAALQARRSRRVITSALDDQLALDSGPIAGHSLFTGSLIEALEGGIARHGEPWITGSQLGIYVQSRVTSYEGSRQTPDFGALELDERGELLIAMPARPRAT